MRALPSLVNSQQELSPFVLSSTERQYAHGNNNNDNNNNNALEKKRLDAPPDPLFRPICTSLRFGSSNSFQLTATCNIATSVRKLASHKLLVFLPAVQFPSPLLFYYLTNPIPFYHRCLGCIFSNHHGELELCSSKENSPPCHHQHLIGLFPR